jgi:hypothetical protein
MAEEGSCVLCAITSMRSRSHRLFELAARMRTATDGVRCSDSSRAGLCMVGELLRDSFEQGLDPQLREAWAFVCDAFVTDARACLESGAERLPQEASELPELACILDEVERAADILALPRSLMMRSSR